MMSDMSDTDDQNDKSVADKKPLKLPDPGRLELKKTVDGGQVRQSFSHGRSRAVAVEVKKKRIFKRGEAGTMLEVTAAKAALLVVEAAPPPPPVVAAPPTEDAGKSTRGIVLRSLTEDEKAARARAVGDARKADEDARQRAELERGQRAEDEKRLEREKAEAERRQAEEDDRRKVEEESRRKAAEEAARRLPVEPAAGAPREPGAADEEGRGRGRRGRVEPRRPTLSARRTEPRRRSGKLTVATALETDERVRSLAAVRRAREREKRALQTGGDAEGPHKVVREVVVPESMTVQELANRMAVRGAELVKALMNMGTMATINQSIDADTAELLVAEFGHRVKRVSAADVEVGLKGTEDDESDIQPRPPVVTVMGHVDHGKTTLLDALRETDVAAGEAGGITQHIGAYQVRMANGALITFLDTPGHEAFTSMRARGASVTDTVVLVVAADDGIMPQTVEAIDHAKAANVPIIVAINKIDRPDADPNRVRQELLSHEIVTEDMGGETVAVEISAKEKLNLDKLEEIILLHAELLDLKANPNRPAEGTVVEAKVDLGRGVIATLLIGRGTLRVGDIVVVGNSWGKVRAMLDYKGGTIEEAGPSVPVQILGLNNAPEAGDEMYVVESEKRAREIAEFREGRARDARTAEGVRGSVEQMFAQIADGVLSELPLVIKGDVHGSVEAIVGSLSKLATDEVAARFLHTGVGGIMESDVSLAEASGGLILGFNVRPNKQAREAAHRAGVEMRFYSVIYELIDEVRQMLSGMLAPARNEKVLGSAEILEVFNIGKVGRVAGCRVTDGTVRRGANARLMRDSVIIHDGSLSTLKRFKEEVKEVREGNECGMAFENYQDFQLGDAIEIYEIEEVARSI